MECSACKHTVRHCLLCKLPASAQRLHERKSARIAATSKHRAKHRRGIGLCCSAAADDQEWQAPDWGVGHDREDASVPSISLLTEDEKNNVLSVLPSAEQIQSVEKKETQLVGFVAAFVIFFASGKYPAVMIGSIALAFTQFQLRAAIRNAKVRYLSGKPYAGIWHAMVLQLSAEQRMPSAAQETAQPTQVCRLRIGEPGVSGFSSELEVPWGFGCERLQQGDDVEVLVLSDNQYFEDFQVVRDVYVPGTGLWLCDYPFLKRDPFQNLSASIFQIRMQGGQEQYW